MTVHTSDDRWLDAPVETVMTFMDEPSNQAAVTPSLSRAERIERLPNSGNRAASSTGCSDSLLTARSEHRRTSRPNESSTT